MSGNKPRVIVVGMDGASPELIRMYRARMPRFSGLIEKGAFVRGLPYSPVDTPTNWTTLGTGATPAVHGRLSFNIRVPGKGITETRDSFAFECNEAEYLWDAAERQGKRALVVNWPGSWPGKLEQGVLIGGDHVFPDAWRIAGASCWHKGDLGVKGGTELSLEPAQGWAHVPESHKPPLATEIGISGGLAYTYDHNGLHVTDERGTGLEAFPRYHLLFLARFKTHYDTVIVSPEKDASKSVANLAAGEWSHWLYEYFMVKSEEHEGAFRFKLVDLSGDLSKVRLYCTEVRQGRDWTRGARPDIGPRLRLLCGPYFEGLEHPAGMNSGFFDEDTHIEHMRMQCRWMVEATELLTREVPDWDLLCCQLHLHDSLGHGHLCQLWDRHPAYTRDRAALAKALYEGLADAVDELIGGIVERCADENTTVFVVSDHGMLPNVEAFWLPGALTRAGLVMYARDGDNFTVDWARTKVFTNDNVGVWVNLAGREPHGSVEPEEYENVRDEAIAALESIRHPETGERLLEYALRREDAVAHGFADRENVPDIVIAARAGYFPIPTQESYDLVNGATSKYSIAPSPDAMAPLAFTGDMIPLTGPIASHTPYLPWGKLGGQSNSGILVVHGPRVKQGYEDDEGVRLSALAPTVARILEMDPPAQNCGEVMDDIFEDDAAGD